MIPDASMTYCHVTHLKIFQLHRPAGQLQELELQSQLLVGWDSRQNSDPPTSRNLAN